MTAPLPKERSRRVPGAARALGAEVRAETRAEAAVAEAVRAGLTKREKTLPAWLFYDAEGSRLFERITELPEYYLSRAEHGIFVAQADAIVAALARGTSDLLSVAEIGAGTATKSQILLRAVAKRQWRVPFFPSDVSADPLRIARDRIAREVPQVTVRPIVAAHEEALANVPHMEGRQAVFFIGSSIGNYEHREAVELLAHVRRGLRAGGALLLGTDLRKGADVLVPAYDDAEGVTAAFNKNVLARINRELGGRFDLDRFRHVAVWNDAASRMEMHLESLVDQVVRLDTLGADVAFRRGERVHTESSVKYDDGMVDALCGATGFTREETFVDDARTFAVHVARVVAPF